MSKVIEEQLMSELTILAEDLRPREDTLSYLADSLAHLRLKHLTIKDLAGPMRVYVLQSITRSGGRRKLAASLLVSLLQQVGSFEADYFKEHIDMFETDLRAEGRSFLDKINTI